MSATDEINKHFDKLHPLVTEDGRKVPDYIVSRAKRCRAMHQALNARFPAAPATEVVSAEPVETVPPPAAPRKRPFADFFALILNAIRHGHIHQVHG